VRVDEDFAPYIINTRNGIIPCLKDARRTGYKFFLRKDEVLLNGAQNDVNYLLNNVQLGDYNRAVDTPGTETKNSSQRALGQTNKRTNKRVVNW
jgi:hypothetical protein